MTYVDEDDTCAGFAEPRSPDETFLGYKRLDWLAVCEVAPLLTDIDQAAKYDHPCMLVEVLDSRRLSGLLDASQTMWPLWFVKLPHLLWPHAQELAMHFPNAINRESDDLLHNHTYYCSLVVPPDKRADQTRHDLYKPDEGVGFVFFSGFVHRSIDAACELGGINVLLRAGSTAILASYVLNEDELMGLEAAGSSSGPNWRPHRIYDQGAMAAVASLGAGGDQYVLGTLPPGQYSCAVIPFDDEP